MREVKVSEKLAARLGRLREAAVAGSWSCRPRGGNPGRLRLQDLERVEAELDVRLPNPIIAYLVGEVSAWGDGPVSVMRVLVLTAEVRDALADAGHTPGGKQLAKLVAIDDDSNGNYVVFRRGEKAASEQLALLDHEGWELHDQTLSEAIDRRLEGSAVDEDAEPFGVELFDEPAPPATEVWVSHKKFGRGLVVDDGGENVTVRFDGIGEKRLRREFLSFE